jgi:uncharacterized protein (TIGR02265 family)
MVPVDDGRGSFGAPDFSKPFDLSAYLANTPEDATCKGLYFQDVIKAVRSAGRTVSVDRLPQLERRYMAFSDYSLREHMELTTQVASILYPGLSMREGLRRLGWLVFPAFAESLVGKVIFTIFGQELDRVYELGPRSFPASMSRGRAETKHVGDRHWRITFSEIYGFLDSYYVGVIEGPIRRVRKTADVRLHASSLSDGVMDVRWSEQPITAGTPG